MKTRKGFTLIEAVIAMTIAAIGFAGIYELYAGIARSERAAMETSYAAQLGEGLLASASDSGEGDVNGYAWRITIEDVAEMDGLERIRVEIDTPRGRTVRISSERTRSDEAQ
jgi:prepilin-type N-terminal cleavage/methylation domain-containing protein